MHMHQREALVIELCSLSEEKQLHKVSSSQEVVSSLCTMFKRESSFDVPQIRWLF